MRENGEQFVSPKENSEDEAVLTEEEIFVERDRVKSGIRKLLKGMGTDADAEDLTQDVMEKALQNRKEFKREAKVGTWLQTIARRKVLDFFRRQKHRVMVEKSEEIEAVEEHRTGVNEIDPLMRDYFALAFSQLNDEEKKLIQLHVDGFSAQQIAEEMRVAETAIKSRIFRAKKHLQEILKEFGLIE